MKQQYQGQEVEQEPESRSDSRNDIFQARKYHSRKNNRTDQLCSAQRNDSGQQANTQDFEAGKLAKRDLKNDCFLEENSRLIDEKHLDRNIEKKRKSYKAQTQNTDRAGHRPYYPYNTRRSRSTAPSEEREILEEPTRRGRSPVVRGPYKRQNNHYPPFRQRARSQVEPPRWFSQMDRYRRDNLEQLFAQ